MSLKPTGKTRFKVVYHPQADNDWDLLRGNADAYFDTLDEAKTFAEKWKHKGKPFYWQPTLFKEDEYLECRYLWRPR